MLRSCTAGMYVGLKHFVKPHRKIKSNVFNAMALDLLVNNNIKEARAKTVETVPDMSDLQMFVVMKHGIDKVEVECWEKWYVYC